MLLDILRHHLAFWNDEGLVSCASCRLQHPVFIVCGEQQAVGDIITVETRTIDGENALDKLRGKTAHRVDTKLHQQLFGILLPHVADGQIDDEIVIRLSPLQETLATFHVLHEVGGIAPDTVGGRHIDAGVELPARPRIILR